MKIIDRKFLPVREEWGVDRLSVHAATIAWHKDHFVYSWFGGTQEGFDDVRIFVYNLNNNDDDFCQFGGEDCMPRWNPILFSYKDELFLFEKSGKFCDRWQTFIHNLSCHEKCILPAGLNGPVKTKPVEFNGKIYCGSSVETHYDWTSYIEEYKIKNGKWIFINRSNPLCVDKKKYNSNGVIKYSQGIIQPTLWEDKGVLKALFRSSNGLDNAYYSYMKKNGDWSTPCETNILNPNSGMDVVFFNNNLYAVYNHSRSLRNPLVVAKMKQKSDTEFDIEAEDDILVIKDNPSSVAGYSYPYMIEHDGMLHLVYTHERTNIEYCRIAI